MKITSITPKNKPMAIRAASFVLGFAILGGAVLLLTSHAATPAASIESETGTITAPATKVTDSTAASGQAVKFNASTTSAKPTQLSQPFYTSLGGQPYNAYKAETDPTIKNQLWQIAGTPIATWFGVDTSQTHFEASVTNAITAAHGQNATPVFVLYAIPGRDCGNYSAGGFPDITSYEQWVDWFTTALGNNPALVIVEPDAIGFCSNFTAQEKADRIAELKYDNDVIDSRDPNAYSYIHAGSGELNVSDAVAVLAEVDTGKGRGIAMNVSGIGSQSTEASAANALITALAAAGAPGMHYVVDTSRNGIGPNGQTSCNPPGLAVGVRPTTQTSDPLADAYLWIKTPGGSDGQCHTGDPAAGTFMPTLAEGMAQLALTDNIITDLPTGTLYTGH